MKKIRVEDVVEEALLLLREKLKEKKYKNRSLSWLATALYLSRWKIDETGFFLISSLML